MTPLERVAFWLPLSLGGLVAALLGVGLVAPQWQQWQQAQARLEALRASETQLPLLRRQLAVQLEQQATAQRQQDLLLRLIAGSGDLATVLAQMDRVAGLTGVQLDLYEPQQAPPEPQAKAGGRGREKPAPPPDPLAVEGLEKQTVLLAAKGSFGQVLAFLRGIERLNLLVVQSDLQLALEEPKSGAAPPAASPSAPAASPAPPGPAKVVLKLNVSLYGRASRPAAAPSPALAGQG